MRRPTEDREIRDSRRAYACALATRLDDLLSDDDPEEHDDEARDIVASLSVLLRRDRDAEGGR